MLELDNIELKPFDEKHLEMTLEWVNDLSIMNYINRVIPVTMMEHKEWFKNITLDKRQTIFAIETKTPSCHIGNCGLKDLDFRSQKAELWIYMGKEHIGKGDGKKAVELLLNYGFRYLNLNRIYLYTLAYNKAAFKTFSYCGFKQEGIFKEDVFINGQFHDTIRMAVLRNEYFIGRNS